AGGVRGPPAGRTIAPARRWAHQGHLAGELPLQLVAFLLRGGEGETVLVEGIRFRVQTREVIATGGAGLESGVLALEVGQPALGGRQFLVVLGDLLRQELLRLLRSLLAATQ